MSAGRRKADPLDRYDTPLDVTRAFLRAWLDARPEIDGPLEPMAVWEPAAGAGQMIAPLRETFPAADLFATDVEPRGKGVRARDFLETYDIRSDLIITNPPFRLAERFLSHAMRVVREEGYVVLLLRAAFLESLRRSALLEEFPPIAVYFLRNRPRFTGPNSANAGSDSAMYAWFVWQKGKRPLCFDGRIL